MISGPRRLNVVYQPLPVHMPYSPMQMYALVYDLCTMANPGRSSLFKLLEDTAADNGYEKRGKKEKKRPRSVSEDANKGSLEEVPKEARTRELQAVKKQLTPKKPIPKKAKSKQPKSKQPQPKLMVTRSSVDAERLLGVQPSAMMTGAVQGCDPERTSESHRKLEAEHKLEPERKLARKLDKYEKLKLERVAKREAAAALKRLYGGTS